MDPNACFKRIIEAAHTEKWDECSAACEDLCDWLKKGGAMPEVSREGLVFLSGVIGRFFGDDYLMRGFSHLVKEV